MDQLDSRYKDVREQLYTLGFHQQLPIGSMSIVSALLEDLIKVTDRYKQSKETVQNLLEEKNAWDLGIEPYKCDNSRLLAENNALHLELINLRGHYERKLIDLNRKIQNLEVDKNYLDDHCFELVSQIREMEQRRKNLNVEDGKVMHKKPFISTVRSGNAAFPNSSVQHSSRRCDGKPNPEPNSNDQHIQVIRLRNENQLSKDETDSLKKQLESCDNEISRLHKQLHGGRPVAALGRDCCYRGIDTLAEDMKSLQKQLMVAKKDLSDSLEQQHEAKIQAIKLDEEKTKYAKDLKEMEEFTLKFQHEANEKIMEFEKKYEKVVEQLNESLRKINALETGGKSTSSTSQQNKMIENMKILLDKANEENDNLIERLINNEHAFTDEMKILSRKNSKLEEKINILQSRVADKPHKLMLTKATATEPQREATVSKEKLFLQSQYLRRLNQPAYERELENVQTQLALREIEIDELKEQLCGAMNKHSDVSSTTISLQTAMNRMEREADTSKLKIKKLTEECADLKQKLKEVLEELHNEQTSYTTQILELKNKIKQLQNDNRLRETQVTGVSHDTKISRLTEQIEENHRELEELHSENRKLKNSQNQIKILQDQTEKSLIDYQHRLHQAESDLAHERDSMNAKLTFTNKTISSLTDENLKFKSIVDMLNKDRAETHNQLDLKTEQLFRVEAEMRKLSSDNDDLNSKNLSLLRDIS
ncbi:Centrosomal protein of 135 kDa [Pseudolycoriella hygida]|uniref:Centrosomal protein of 135 kDa n=1 Tax=Pseudolycoriella hygida TaxID=35572 RepID=A0A9Q0N4F8_9DIPT|nr:Centrosomal protein of 135 kDa [Pseudolycoriella hygida]